MIDLSYARGLGYFDTETEMHIDKTIKQLTELNEETMIVNLIKRIITKLKDDFITKMVFNEMINDTMYALTDYPNFNNSTIARLRSIAYDN